MRMSTAGGTMRSAVVLTALAVLIGCSSGENKPGTKDTSKNGVAAKLPEKERSAPIPPAGQSDAAAAKQGAKKTRAQAKEGGDRETPEKQLSDAMERVEEKPRNLGPPLVDDAGELKRLHPEQPVWLDLKNRHIVVQGEACRAGYPLEFFATYSNRSYEAVIALNVTPSIIHAGLLMTAQNRGTRRNSRCPRGATSRR